MRNWQFLVGVSALPTADAAKLVFVSLQAINDPFDSKQRVQ